MFYCVCVENNRVVSVLQYKPNVPKNVNVYEISHLEYQDICDGDSYFDLETLSVKKKIINIPKENEKKLNFLRKTDWKILRLLRESYLKIPTSLTEEEFQKLEEERQKISKEII